MAEQLVKILKSLSDQTRIDMVKFLIIKKESSCQEVSKKFPLSQPTLSHHFNKLMDSGILKVRKNGAAHYYSIDKKLLSSVGININKFI